MMRRMAEVQIDDSADNLSLINKIAEGDGDKKEKTMV